MASRFARHFGCRLRQSFHSVPWKVLSVPAVGSVLYGNTAIIEQSAVDTPASIESSSNSMVMDSLSESILTEPPVVSELETSIPKITVVDASSSSINDIAEEDESSSDESSDISQGPKVSKTLIWGKSFSKSPKTIGFLKNKQVKKVQFSQNLQVALDEQGSLHVKYLDNFWTTARFPEGLISGTVADFGVCDHSMYLVDSEGGLIEVIFDCERYKKQYECTVEERIQFEEKQQGKESDHLDIDLEDRFVDEKPDSSNFEAQFFWYDTVYKKSDITDGSEDDSNSKSNRTVTSEITHFADIFGDGKQIAMIKSHFGLPSLPNNNNTDVNESNRPTKVWCRNDRCLVLLENGRVFSRGNNRHGALGVGKIAKSQRHSIIDIEKSSPSMVDVFVEIDPIYFDSPVSDVSLGRNHTLFVTRNGRLFSCGADNFLQLGLGWTKMLCKRMDANWSVLGRAGYDYCMNQFRNELLTVQNYQRDLPYFYEVPSHIEYIPRVVIGPFFDEYRVISVSAGDFHSAVIAEPLNFSANVGEIIRQRFYHESEEREKVENILPNDTLSREGWKSEWERLRAAKKEELRIKALEKAKKYCEQRGIDYSEMEEDSILKEHVQNELEQMTLSDSRVVVTWGSSLKGQVGHSNFSNATEPRLVQALNDIREYSPKHGRMMIPKPIQVQCGKEHTMVLLEGHSEDTQAMVFGFGSNQYRQICTKPQVKIPAPVWLKSILPNKLTVIALCANNDRSAILAS